MDTSYLTSQVSTIIGQLHGLFDDIGVPGHEREARESEVSCPRHQNLQFSLICYTSYFPHSPKLYTIKFEL
jgi:protein regulator of cytokinesis 1